MMKVPFIFLCLIILYSTFSNTDTVMASPPEGTIPAYGPSCLTGGVFWGRALGNAINIGDAVAVWEEIRGLLLWRKYRSGRRVVELWTRIVVQFLVQNQMAHQEGKVKAQSKSHKKFSTLQCPSHSCRNPPGSAGLRPDST